MRPGRAHRHQPAITGVTPIIEQDILRLHRRQMLVGQFGLGHRRGGQPALQPHLIEHIVEHRHAGLRVALQRPALIGALHPAEGFADGRPAGQPHQRTVHTQQPVALPALHQRGVLRPVHRGQHGRRVEFDERAGAQFGPGMRQRAATEFGARVAVGQLVQKLMHMGLERLETFLQQQEHEHGKGQHTLPREVAGPAAMARPEGRIDERLAQSFNESEGTFLQWEVVAHPKDQPECKYLVHSNNLQCVADSMAVGPG